MRDGKPAPDAPPADTPDTAGTDTAPPPPPLLLDGFVPYRLSVLANVISRSVAAIYEERFGLTIPEWRVMAVLGLEDGGPEPVSANSVAARTAMDKVQVSRAIARMVQAGLVSRDTDSADRRRSALALTDKGLAVYRQIVPAARRYEQELLAALSPEDQAALDRLLSTLHAAAVARARAQGVE